MAHYIDVKVQFKQVAIQHHTKFYILSKDLKVAAIVFLVFLIVSNIVSLAAVPITHH